GALLKNKTLIRLNLQNNLFKSSGAMIKSLTSHPTLKRLNLSSFWS
ncbi:MAG: hypothetical protein RIS64_352, partial [Bacteroidota bacterium]